jgi:YD repeat-containing protein
MYRLTAASGPDGARTYTYDPAGNRASIASGGITMHTLDTPRGRVEWLIGAAEVRGNSLVLRDFALNASGGPNSLGPGVIPQLKRQMVAEAKLQGFSEVWITGLRVSGADPLRDIHWIVK